MTNTRNLSPSPDSPQPGFRVPRIVNIEYLESDPENYESQITEADITKEYEKDPKNYARDKEDFEKQEKEDRDARDKEDKEAAAAKAAAEKKPAADVKPKESTPKEPTPPSKPETKSDATPKASPAAGPTASPEAKPAAGAGCEARAYARGRCDARAREARAVGRKANGQFVGSPSSPFRLAAYVDDKTADKTPPAVTEKSSAAKGAEKQDTAAPPAPQAAAEQKRADNKQPATDSKASPKSDSTSDVKQDSSKKAESSKPADTMSAAAGPDKNNSAAKDAAKKEERKPIKTAEERLRDYIRKQLAGNKYRENMAKVRKALNDYRDKYVNAGDEKPKPPDFAVLAKKYKMTAHRSGLVSTRQLSETDFGKSQDCTTEKRAALFPLLGEIFGPTTLYKVGESYAASPSPTGSWTLLLSGKPTIKPAACPNGKTRESKKRSGGMEAYSSPRAGDESRRGPEEESHRRREGRKVQERSQLAEETRGRRKANRCREAAAVHLDDKRHAVEPAAIH